MAISKREITIVCFSESQLNPVPDKKEILTCISLYLMGEM
jgi:hypothetical protein